MSLLSNNTLAGSSGQGGAAGYQIERSLRFNLADDTSLTRSITGTITTYTVSMWVKRAHIGGYQFLWDSGGKLFGFFSGSEAITLYNGSHNVTTSVYRDASAWMHLVLSVNSGTATLYVNNASVKTGVTGFSVTGTAYIGEYSAGAYNYQGYMADVHFIDGQALAATDFGEYDDNNVWQPIEFAGTYGTNGFHLDFSDTSSDSALGTDSSGNGNDWTVNNLFASSGAVPTLPANTYNNNTMGYYMNGNPPLFLTTDPGGTNRASSITHGSNTGTTWAVDDVLQWAVDQDTGKMWLGRNNTWYSGNPASATDPAIASWSSGNLYLGKSYNSTTLKLEVATTAAYTPPTGYTYWSASSTGSWVGSGNSTSNVANDLFNTAIPTTGKVYIEAKIKGGLTTFSCIGLMNLGETVTENDALRDSPTNGTQTDTGVGGEVVGNYATINPLTIPSGTTYSNGNLDITKTVAAHAANYANFGMSSGKWYWEITKTTNTADGGDQMGLVDSSEINNPTGINGVGRNVIYLQASTIYIYDNNVNTYFTATAANNTNAGTFMYAFDADAGKFYIGKDGTWYSATALTGGNPSTGTGAILSNFTAGERYFPEISGLNVGQNYSLNFGQRAFAYTAPSGYKCLCTANLPDPTIADGSTAFDAVTYTGNGSTQVISGLNMSPGLVWMKRRDGTNGHSLMDVVRGTGVDLESNSFDAEDTTTTTITSFNSDGWTLGSRAGTNGSSSSYIGWTWDAGSTFTPTVSGFTSPSGRRNTTAGFSIVKVTGNNTVSSFDHGLGVAPALIISKNLDNAYDWGVYHEAVEAAPTQKFLNLNDADAVASKGGNIYRVVSSSSVEVGSYAETGSNGDYVYYCFAPVSGYSAFGSYTGNGSTDGPFVFTGFRPKFIIVKRTDTTSNWWMFDSERGTNELLYPNLANAEGDQGVSVFEFNSNGFKLRVTDSEVNASNATYIYATFASHPFKTSRAR